MNRKIVKECESSCEYILPDYMGDIKKLLMSRAKTVPTGKFTDDGNIEISGSVEYDIFYSDAEGKLTAINTSSDFSHNIPVDTEKHIDSSEESRVSSLKIRVCGPRKIAVKAEIETALTIAEENDFSIDGNVFSEEEPNVEKCTRLIKYANSIFKKSGEREYAEIAGKIEKTDSSDVETVAVFGTVRLKEAKAGEGAVTVKGENRVSAILKTQTRPPFCIKTAIPFEETIEADGVTPEMQVIADGLISSVSIGLGNEEDPCVAVANIIAEYSVEAVQNLSETVVTDAYIPTKETINKYTEAEYCESIFSGTKEFYLEVRSKKNEYGLSEVGDIIASDCEIRNAKASLSKSGCDFSGEIVASAIVCEANVEGDVSYVPVKMQKSFMENVNFDLQIPEETVLDCAIEIKDCEPYVDAENLNIRCLAVAKMHLFKNSSIKRLCSCQASEGELKKHDSAVINVYYPKTGERLFDVAKRYHTTSAKIAMDNSLSESVVSMLDSPDSLSGIKKLIIR